MCIVVSMHSLLLKHGGWSFSQCDKKRKGNKVQKNRNEDIRVSLFLYYMIMSVKKKSLQNSPSIRIQDAHIHTHEKKNDLLSCKM